MRLSVIPWEIIWLTCLLVFVIIMLVEIVRQVRNRKVTWPTSLLFYAVIVGLIFIPLSLNLTNYRFDLSSGPVEYSRYDHQLVDLRPQIYSQHSLDELYQASIEALKTLKSYGFSWTITYVQPDTNGVAQIKALAPIMIFTDEVSISIESSLGEPGLAIMVLSGSSRPYDFGQNGRNILKFYRALNEELSKLE